MGCTIGAIFIDVDLAVFCPVEVVRVTQSSILGDIAIVEDVNFACDVPSINVVEVNIDSIDSTVNVSSKRFYACNCENGLSTIFRIGSNIFNTSEVESLSISSQLFLLFLRGKALSIIAKVILNTCTSISTINGSICFARIVVSNLNKFTVFNFSGL